MQKWVEARRADPAGADPTSIESLAAWLAERQELAGQNTALQSKDAGRNW